MNALILLAHGSRRSESNLEVESLSNEIYALISNKFDFVEYAFLEMAEPSLMDSIDGLIKKNASKITIFPYFLNSGVHIKSDIPVIVEKAKVKYDNCTFKLTLPIGAYKGMAKLISEQINLS